MTLNNPLGLMNRPYGKFSLEEALSGIAGAGFKHMCLLVHQQQYRISPDTSLEEARKTLQTINSHGIELTMLPSSLPLKEGVAVAEAAGKRLIDLAAGLGVHYLLEMGVHQPELYESYIDLMRTLAPYAHERGIVISVKPHGGATTTGEDCLRVLRAVNHAAYRLCFDPGNLLYYSNEDPLLHLKELAPYTVAMCIKDETGGLRGNVDVTPGDGDVNFRGVFTALRDAGFQGPCIVETLASRPTAAEVNVEARRAHSYLTTLLESL